MQKSSLLLLILLLISLNVSLAQNRQGSISTADTINISLQEVKGVLLDFNTHEPLSYANIYVLHQNMGTITNENGYFSLSIQGVSKTDSIRFKYIGYKTKAITIADMDTSTTVYLKEEIFNLDEILIFGDTPDARSIVKKVVENLDSNYPEINCEKQIFIRERYTSDINEIHINFKKSSIPAFDRKMIADLEKKIPRHSTSYSDFLGNFYFSNNEDDSIRLKVNPLKTVALKDKNLAEFEELMSVFDKNFKKTNQDEYWKVKTGIFSQKLDLEPDSSRGRDTLAKDERKVEYFRRRISYRFKYSTLKDKDDWEFLYKTGKYNFTIVGGTRVNGEDVYIINFEPDGSGLYMGKMYIAMESYALIRADYEYAPKQTGTDFHMFGVGYTENLFSGSIYFEKAGDYYKLKYFSKKAGSIVNFDRGLALLKKKERFLFDKKLNEIKVGVNVTVKSEQLFECLVLETKPISHKVFVDYKEKNAMKIIFVDKFDDNLWKGYDIIEPTQQMRDYKKQR